MDVFLNGFVRETMGPAVGIVLLFIIAGFIHWMKRHTGKPLIDEQPPP